MHRILILKYAQTPALCQALQQVLLTNRVPVEATSNVFWRCGVNMRVVKKSTPEQLFSHQVDGKNYLNFYPAVTDSRRKNGQSLLAATFEKATPVNGGRFSRSEKYLS